MVRTATVAIVMMGVLMAGTARASGAAASGAPPLPTSLSVSIFSADRTPDIDPADGTLRPFLCLSVGRASGPVDECFVFHPKVDALHQVRFATGGSITRSGAVWTELPGGFHFAQKSLSRDRLVIFDATRDITWSLDLPHGASTIRSKGTTATWYKVVGVGYDPDPAGYVAAPEVSQRALKDQPSRPQGPGQVFTRKVDPRLRTDLYTIINAWNAKPHTLGSADCMDLIDAVSATIGVKRPPHARTLSAAAYVDDLIKLNP